MKTSALRRWLRADALRAAILEAVAAGPMYGLQIIDHARARGVLPWWRSIYPNLRAMERDGLLVSHEEPDRDGRRGGRPARYCSVHPW